MVLRAIFNDSQLQAEADLRRGQADAGGEAKRLKHVGDGLLKSGRGDLISEERTRELLQKALAGGANVDALTPKRETLEAIFVRKAL